MEIEAAIDFIITADFGPDTGWTDASTFIVDNIATQVER